MDFTSSKVNPLSILGEVAVVEDATELAVVERLEETEEFEDTVELVGASKDVQEEQTKAIQKGRTKSP